MVEFLRVLLCPKTAWLSVATVTLPASVLLIIPPFRLTDNLSGLAVCLHFCDRWGKISPAYPVSVRGILFLIAHD